MTELVSEQEQTWVVTPPDISHLITEDDTPVDNLFSERQMNLLRNALYASWSDADRTFEDKPRPFVALANVGLFYALAQSPYVPDVLVSMDVELPEEPFQKEHRSYFLWEYGKPPDIVVEVVSNRVGNELTRKRTGYARLGITYYIVYDPELHLGNQDLYVFELRGGQYTELTQHWLSSVRLGITRWHGMYQGMEAEWIRWCDIDSSLLLVGEEMAAEAQEMATQAQERATRAEEHAEQERERAEQERERAEQEHVRVERLAEKLRALGIDPNAE